MTGVRQGRNYIDSNDLATINDFHDLARLFHDKLGWEKETWETYEHVDEMYGLKGEESLRDVSRLAAVLNLEDDQTWGIFLVDYGKNPLRRSALRQILNKIAAKARTNPPYPTWPHDNILFICKHRDGFTLCHFRGDRLADAKLKSFSWSPTAPSRTALENLNKLVWNDDWADAWDVETLSKDFFESLSQLFFDTVDALKGVIPDGSERRLFVQTLFNRLIFLRFVEKKGHLRFFGRDDYLRALWEAGKDPTTPFWPTRLNALFTAVNHQEGDNERKAAESLIGEVVFLNGGLFDENPRFNDPAVVIPDSVFERLLGPSGLLYRYNFTVEESSPLDVEVAVDPEVLGRVFEKLTISEKRHDTGSYYTPREIVQFMCREALVGYLCNRGLGEDKARQLVYEHDTRQLSDGEGRTAWDAMFAIKVVDPACGSGAYLLGMLQELYALSQLLDRPDPRLGDDPKQREHKRKLWIIENNLYGVDIQQFATNTAMLRLWLTLLVEDTGAKPQPLPNLEYKIETGDSLLGPDPSQPIDFFIQKKGEGAALDFWDREKTIKELRDLRAKYQDFHGPAKTEVKAEFEAKLAELREKVSGSSEKNSASFDWRVEFFDVFLSDSRKPGFDVVTANPPYVNSGELLRAMGREYKESLMRHFPRTATGTADLLVYFMDRAVELLRPGGQFAFITSNKWLKAAYGKKLRGQMAARTHIHHLMDFKDLPVFQGTIAYPLITIATKRHEGDKSEATTRFTEVTSLNPPYPDLPTIIQEWGGDLPPGSLGKDGTWRLETGEGADRLAKMRERGIPLGEYVNGRIYRGILTGLNEVKIGDDGKMYGKSVPPGVRVVRKEGVFVIDGAKRAELIAEDPKSAEIIKPLAIGRDIRRWVVENNDRWLIVTKIGTDMTRYPAIMRHLEQFRPLLEIRQDRGEHYWELRACAYYDAFESPKIIYGQIMSGPLFAFHAPGNYCNQKCFVIANGELYVLGLLNSQVVFNYLKANSPVLSGGFIEPRKDLVETIPIPAASAADRAAIESLVQRILYAKSADRDGDVSDLEAEIDRRVEFLYFGEGDSYEDALARDVAEVRMLLRPKLESATLEFKETLWYDTRQGGMHGDRVLDVMKAVCAMLNRSGGTILIGVNDDAEIVGIERDLVRLETLDKFQRKFQEAFGVKLRPDPSDLVRIRFISIDGKTVARVDVTGDRSTMYTLSDKVYVRRDGASVMLGSVDTAHWWQRRKEGEA